MSDWKTWEDAFPYAMACAKRCRGWSLLGRDAIEQAIRVVLWRGFTRHQQPSRNLVAIWVRGAIADELRAYSQFPKRICRELVRVGESECFSSVSPVPDPEQQAIANNLKQFLLDSLVPQRNGERYRRTAAQHRQRVDLVCLKGWQLRDVAIVQECSVGNVCLRLQDATAVMRQALEEEMSR